MLLSANTFGGALSSNKVGAFLSLKYLCGLSIKSGFFGSLATDSSSTISNDLN